jgi:hypothetical protein
MSAVAPELTTMKDRLTAFINAVLSSSKFPATIRPIIINFVSGYLNKMEDAEIEKMLIGLRDDFIPFVLTGGVEK